MTPLKFTLTPQTAFATPLKGDTLFGQLCWAARHILGEARLNDVLQGYTDGKPYLVVSDAFPAGFLPMPKLPRHYWQFDDAQQDPSARKALKKRQWLPVAALSEPLGKWLEHARADVMTLHSDSRPHNTINRATNTTGTGEFAPYTVEQTWYQAGQILELYVLLDETRLAASELESLLNFVGASGFGRDASTGLGKFTLAALTPTPLPRGEGLAPNAWLTLAPCAPQGLAWDNARCYYKPFTRFGRHGDAAAISCQPYKTPLLLADTAAILSPRTMGKPGTMALFTGQGLGGDGSLSNALPQTVHQGYAPVIGICLPS
ncbi:MAG: hypothetical protein Q8O38_05220 [Sulfurimicrobium sp.]|nr:hypothetical protein [Sulfurimicrobium sp.]